MDTIKEKIFLSYDIRGLYPKEINADVSWRLGYYLPSLLIKEGFLPKRKLKIVVGRDVRKNGFILLNNLIQGLIQNNVEVMDAGIITTPLLYFLIKNYQFDLGIIITGSHLNENYTGFKIYTNELKAITGEQLKKYLTQFNQPVTIGLIKGKQSRKNFSGEYANFLLKQSGIKKYLANLQNKNILVCCPKTTQLILEKIKKELKIKMQFVHRPIPKRLLNKRKNDFMVQFDADGDRLYVVQKNGEEVLGDVLGAFFIELLKDEKPKKVILDCRCSCFLEDLAKKYNFEVIYSKAGHSFFKEAMKKNQALLGIEKSGHYYWRDFFYADSGIFSFLMLLKFLAKENQPLPDLIKKFVGQKIIGPEINFKLKSETQALRIIQKIESQFAKMGEISKIDGLTVKSKNFHFNLRPSNTEPSILRLNLEASDQKTYQDILSRLTKIIKH